MRALNVASGPRKARLLLAAIRLFNGAAALLVPQVLARRLGADPDSDPALLYALRMFGVRTVVLGVDLLVQTGERRAESLRRGMLIHASDTIAAALAGLSGRLPGRTGWMITLISLANTLLAVYASSGQRRRRR